MPKHIATQGAHSLNSKMDLSLLYFFHILFTLLSPPPTKIKKQKEFFNSIQKTLKKAKKIPNMQTIK